MTALITGQELAERLDQPDLTIVDVRALSAYNGWRAGGHGPGGHVPGAASFPVSWVDTLDDPEMEHLLADKGVLPGRSIVVYGQRPDLTDAEQFATRLAERGIADVRVLVGGFEAWLADSSRPVDRLARYDRLVDIDWLAEVLAGGRPEAGPTGRFLLFHVNFDAPEEYAEAHIPGAIHLDTNRLEDPRDWNRRSPAELEDAPRGLGITHDTTVVVYGRDTVGQANEKWPGRRAGQIAATRALSILHYAGVDDVRLLDGGYDRWVNAGYPVETQARAPEPVGAFGVSIPHRPEAIVDIDEVRAILADRDGAVLVSVRAWMEHIGRVSGYADIRQAGRIAGDVWGNSGSDAYHMQHYRNIDNTMRAYPEIAASWAAAAITPDKRVAFYCGTGWRASEAWFCAHLQGWERIAVYDGGWREWSQDPVHNPIEVGEPGAGPPGGEHAA